MACTFPGHFENFTCNFALYNVDTLRLSSLIPLCLMVCLLLSFVFIIRWQGTLLWWNLCVSFFSQDTWSWQLLHSTPPLFPLLFTNLLHCWCVCDFLGASGVVSCPFLLSKTQDWGETSTCFHPMTVPLNFCSQGQFFLDLWCLCSKSNTCPYSLNEELPASLMWKARIKARGQQQPIT